MPTNSGARLAMRIRLCASANSTATPLTLASPRTFKRDAERLEELLTQDYAGVRANAIFRDHG